MELFKWLCFTGIIIVIILVIVQKQTKKKKTILLEQRKILLEQVNSFVNNISKNGLSAINSDILLSKSEVLYFSDIVNWYEPRRVTKSISYAGPRANIKIAKGLSYRLGSYNVSRNITDELKLIATGKIYITNKKILFIGNNTTKTIIFNKLVNYDFIPGGILLIKQTGKPVSLECNSQLNIFKFISILAYLTETFEDLKISIKDLNI